MQKENNVNIADFINLFDELLRNYTSVMKKYIFETSWGADEKIELDKAVGKFKKKKDSILKDNVL